MSKSTQVLAIILCVLLWSPTIIKGQLSKQLEGVSKYDDIKRIGEAYYAELDAQNRKKHPSDPKYKHWKRWMYDAELNQLANGDLPHSHARLIGAMKQIKDMERSEERNTIAQWSYKGPDGAISNPSSNHYIGNCRVNRMAFHPTDEDIIYLGMPAGGIWKTTDGGDNWTPLDDYLPSLGISGIVVSHTNPNIVYALSGDGDGGGYGFSSGVYKSSDGGTTWNTTGILSDTSYTGYTLEMDPNNANVLLAATNRGLYRTINGGQTWNLVLSGLVYDIKFKPGSSNHIYAATNGLLFYSTTGGIGTWNVSAMIPALSPEGRRALAVSADDPNRVYAFAAPETSGDSYQGYYYSSNSGANFIRVHNSPNVAGTQTTYDFCTAASPINRNIVVAGGLIIWKSSNSANTFSKITSYGYDEDEDWYVHPDIHDLEFNPLNNKLYAATDGGFYVTSDLGASWTDLTDGLGTAQYYRIDVTSEDENFILGGLQDNGLKLRKSNSNYYDHIKGSDGFSVKFYNGDKNRFYATFNGNAYRYWDAGQSDQYMPIGDHWFCRLAIKSNDNNTLVAGTNDEGGRLYKSTNEGASFTYINYPAGNAVEAAPSDNNLLYFAGSKTMYRSYDFGGSAELISDNPGFPSAANFPTISDIGVHPTDAETVYVTFGGYGAATGVLKSTNLGDTWTDVTGSLPDIPIRCVSVAENGDVYVGALIGIFLLKQGASDWIPYRNGLPNVVINDLVINHTTNTLYAGTFGRGIWSSPISHNDCLTNLTFLESTTLQGIKYYEVSNNISLRSTILGEQTTDIHLQAGGKMDFLPGTFIKSGCNFRALIAACSTGIP